jgi:hypothetical protein
MQTKSIILWFVVMAVVLIQSVTTLGVIGQETEDTSSDFSLRFFGSGINDIDRVKFRIDEAASALNIGGDFTIELFLKASPGENTSGDCATGDAGWIYGNIILDRDIFGPGDYGDFGLSVVAESGIVAFGVSRGDNGATICGTTNIINDQWHHIAVTRSAESGIVQLYVNGVLDGEMIAPGGDISYRAGRASEWPNDPYLVMGAEKHDYDNTTYPSFSGWVDELRISDIIRYTEDFAVPTAPFTPDDNTLGLYHFDEGEGDTILDSSDTESHGIPSFGGTPAGPVWADDTPFSTMNTSSEDAD